jgi:rhamnogalacturonyl hydrolase YesR
LDYLLNVAPKAADGTISTRESEVQLWSDFVYMAPPFIAYYGALEGGSTGATLLQTAYDQVRLYRAVLFDQGVGLWRHIALGSWSDPTHWATGNAWAAAGVLRVLATIKHSPEAGSMQSQQNDLAQWAGETLTGVWKYQVRTSLPPLSPARLLFRALLNTNATVQQANGTLLNYLDQPNSFADSSSTALLAAATFRYASITGDNSHIPAAIKALQLVQDSVSKTGYLLNTVNPETFSTPSGPGQHSPEGQSFVLLLEAAVSAWKSQNNQ